MSQNYVLGLILSCQTKADPDKWRKPAMNEEKKIPTDEEIRNFIIRVEDTLELPLGVLSMPGKGTIKGHAIPAVKQAAIYHLVSSVRVRQKSLAPFFALDQSDVSYHIGEAKKYIDVKDQTFSRYYSIIQDIAI